MTLDTRYILLRRKIKNRVERPLLIMGKVCLPLMGLAFTSFGSVDSYFYANPVRH